ncbi:hypothetical protein ABBQ32_009907 [Trebouxia sp. C0010 RCD-2024]
MAYPSCHSNGDGRSGTINRNAFVGANLGVHASPLEAVTSMDPKDYVWGGGCYNSYYGCQPSGSAGAQSCYYPSTVEYPVSHQYSYASQFHSGSTMQSGVNPMLCPVSMAHNCRADITGNANRLCDNQNSDSEDLAPSAPLDSKVDDLLSLDEASLKEMLSPGSLDEASTFTEVEDTGSCKKPRYLESMASGDSQSSGSEDVILPDFGEGFGNSDGLLLDVGGASSLQRESRLHEASPYFSPLLEPPTLPSAVPAAVMGSSMLHTRTDKSIGQSKKEAVADLLSDMSMADAVRCITQFLRCDKRIADDKRQAAATAVQAVCSSKLSLVVTLRQPAAGKPQLKRKRSTTKALEAARNPS